MPSASPTHWFAILALALGFLVASSPAAETATRSFDIPSGRAEATLRQFATQSGAQFFFSAESVTGLRTNPVKGELTPHQALEALLDRTGLVAVQDEKTGALTVRRDAGPNAARAAQRTGDRPQRSTKVDEDLVRMGAFEVFGSKLINADIPRTRDDAQPYVVFNREQLESSPAANLEDFFRTRLPMNQTFATTASGGTGTTSSINLRGLGSNQTLLLLDGRRLPPMASGGGIMIQADINGIPLSMIERIEVLPATASGIYGGSATGGVINIITRKDYSGVDVALTYQNTFDSDAAIQRIDVNGSFALERGRTMLTVNYSHADASELMSQDRDFAKRSRELQLKNNPAAFYDAPIPPSGSLANIRSLTGTSLVLKSGKSLNSPITFVPAGYAGPASDGGAALAANAGQYDMNFARGKSGDLAKLMAVPTTETIGLGLRRRFGARVEAYVDASRSKNDTSSPQFTTAHNTTIAANAPNNPFTSAIRVSFPDMSPTLPFISTSKSDRLAAGAMVRLPADWSAGADYVYARSKRGSTSASAQLGDPDGTGPGISYTTAVSNGTLNVLRDLYTYPLDLGPYLMPDPFFSGSYDLTSDEWTLRGSGPLLKLPAGPLTLSSSAQWRQESIGESVQTLHNAAGPNPTYNWSPSVGVESLSYYAELRIPVVGKESRIPLVRGLEFQASVRLDDITMTAQADRTNITVPSPDGPFPPVPMLNRDFQAAKSTVGLKYTMTKDFALRASFGEGFLPPSLSQLSPSAPLNIPFAIIDPKRGNVSQVISAVRLTGGEPGLEPEESESTSAGLVLTPRILPGFRLSLDYTRIVKTNEIGGLPPQTLMDMEDQFPGRVVRAPLTAEDRARGYTGGVISELNFRSLNLAGKRLNAWDVQADYTWKPEGWGEFQAYAIATYQPNLETQALAAQPWVQTSGYSFGAVKWRGNGGLNWTRGPWTLAWNTQYIGSYFVYSATAQAAARAIAVLNQGSATIPSQMYHDISASYRWAARSGGGWRRLLAGSQLTLSMQNMFDTSPPIIANVSPIASANVYSTLGDPRLRRYTISLRRKF